MHLLRGYRDETGEDDVFGIKEGVWRMQRKSSSNNITMWGEVLCKACFILGELLTNLVYRSHRANKEPVYVSSEMTSVSLK